MNSILIQNLMDTSGVTFGTSGARGLVSQMSDRVCYLYTRAFLQHLAERGEQIDKVALAGDLRPSTPRIMAAVANAIRDSGATPINCGFIPSPAVALYGIDHHLPSIMVTGSHIPDDRNGIKFNRASGEITKSDEQSIRNQRLTLPISLFDDDGLLRIPGELPPVDQTASRFYLDRYRQLFSDQPLTGRRIGLYQHSSVARDLLEELLNDLGAEVTVLGRSESFVPVDTEAIRPEDIELARGWSQEKRLDSIVSTDGDADRPLISDENGHWLRGDAVGALTGRILSVRHMATPVSCNTAVDRSGWFDQVIRTRIGSPYVIAGMESLLERGCHQVAGYEANGGFLVADRLQFDGRTLLPLPTRDAVLPILALLVSAAMRKLPLSQLVAELPHRYTSSNRLKQVETEHSRILLDRLTGSDGMEEALSALFDHRFGSVMSTDQTDGLRITFSDDTIIHIRPSGNAPELRCYSEADSEERADESNRFALEKIAEAIEAIATE